MKKRYLIWMIPSLLLLLNSCGRGIDVAEWTEEVKLHDGQIVQVWRKARAYSNGFPNAQRGGHIDFELKYAPMNVSWKGDWRYQLAAFEVIDGTPYLVLFLDGKASCKNRSPDDYAAQFLRWKNNRWFEVKQSDFPVNLALMNLSSGFWGHDAQHDYKGLIRWIDKELPGGSWDESHPDTVKSYFERTHSLCSSFTK